jgi:phage-related protein
MSYETEKKYTPRLLIAKFGDGYEQRTPELLNANPRTVTVKVDQTRAIITQIDNFLRSTGGSLAFWFYPPYDAAGTFVADTGWSIVEKGYDYAILTVVLREVFEIV